MTALCLVLLGILFSIIVKLMMDYIPRTVSLLLTLSESFNFYFFLFENFYTWGRFFLDFGPDFGPKNLLYGCLTHYLRNIISERKIGFVISILLKCYKIKIITLSHLKVSFIKYQYFCWWPEKTPDCLILIYQRRI